MACTYETDESVITGFTDANYGAREQDSRSRSGYCFRLGTTMSRSAMVQWKSKLQKTPATSTMESEYMAASDQCTEMYNARENLKIYGAEQKTMDGSVRHSILYCDSISAATCAQEPRTHHKTKSIRTRYHSIRAHCARGPNKIIEIIYINTQDNPSDLFTKILPRHKFEKFRDEIMHITKRTYAKNRYKQESTSYQPKT